MYPTSEVLLQWVPPHASTSVSSVITSYSIHYTKLYDTHCTNTSEIGYIKVLKTERIQDGVERLEYASGTGSVSEIAVLEDTLIESAEFLGIPVDQLPKTVKRFFDEWKDQKKIIEELQT